MQPEGFGFTSRSAGHMVADLNRNRKMSPGHTPLQDLLGNKESARPNMDEQTGLPIAGKYLNGQEQNAAPTPGTLPEEEQEEPGQLRGRQQEGPAGSRIAG